MTNPSFHTRPLADAPSLLEQLPIGKIAVIKYAGEDFCITVMKKDKNNSVVLCRNSAGEISIKTIDNFQQIVLSPGEFAFYLDATSKEPIPHTQVKTGEIVVPTTLAPDRPDEVVKTQGILIRTDNGWINWEGVIRTLSDDLDIQVCKIVPCA
ncbi:hypothetical protein KC711_04420 [Candidatus Peregrinibacteria bacterium]|nr:hypothetical protein [Candidatus Peregrinibacteria bacterium]MCB9804074.1 hypothetical protein [Candidatus Peribacteria bacterium]